MLLSVFDSRQSCANLRNRKKDPPASNREGVLQSSVFSSCFHAFSVCPLFFIVRFWGWYISAFLHQVFFESFLGSFHSVSASLKRRRVSWRGWLSREAVHFPNSTRNGAFFCLRVLGSAHAAAKNIRRANPSESMPTR